jgi:hypothetical protein
MRRSSILATGVAACAAALLGTTGVASAAFPDFSDCPKRTPNITSCVHVQSTAGFMDIKGFRVPIGTSFQIRGAAVASPSSPTGTAFVPPTGTTGVFSKPIQVPGGLLGIDFPIPGNAVTATAQLAGTPSQVNLDLGQLSISIPLKLALTNPIIGPGCQIGSSSNPVRLNLIVGTTNPPPPNRPITGAIGTADFQPNYILVRGDVNVDNSFSVPGASGCGIGLGLINSIVNLKLKLPSAAGNNTISITNDVAIGGLG